MGSLGKRLHISGTYYSLCTASNSSCDLRTRVWVTGDLFAAQSPVTGYNESCNVVTLRYLQMRGFIAPGSARSLSNVKNSREEIEDLAPNILAISSQSPLHARQAPTLEQCETDLSNSNNHTYRFRTAGLGATLDTVLIKHFQGAKSLRKVLECSVDRRQVETRFTSSGWRHRKRTSDSRSTPQKC